MTVRIWDPATGQQQAVMEGQQQAFLAGYRDWKMNGVCEITVSGRHLLASAGDDEMVRIWDPATGQQQAVLKDTTAR